MPINKKIIVLLITILFVIRGFAQEKKNTIHVNLPNSIYSFSNQLSFLNTHQNINDNLNLKQFKFVTINVNGIKGDYRTFFIEDAKKIPTTFVFDRYKYIYSDKNLFKGFDLGLLQ